MNNEYIKERLGELWEYAKEKTKVSNIYLAGEMQRPNNTYGEYRTIIYDDVDEYDEQIPIEPEPFIKESEMRL